MRARLRWAEVIGGHGARAEIKRHFNVIRERRAATVHARTVEPGKVGLASLQSSARHHQEEEREQHRQVAAQRRQHRLHDLPVVR